MENDERKIPILLQTQTEMVSLLQKTNFPYPVRRKKKGKNSQGKQ